MIYYESMNVVRAVSLVFFQIVFSDNLELSRGGGFSKNLNFFESYGDFFRSTKLIVRALPKHYKDPSLIFKNFATQVKF